MAHKGKDEKRAKGYAETMVRRRAGNLDAFYRSVWDGEGSYREGFETPNPDADG